MEMGFYHSSFMVHITTPMGVKIVQLHFKNGGIVTLLTWIHKRNGIDTNLT
jgi:hypothetical protein